MKRSLILLLLLMVSSTCLAATFTAQMRFVQSNLPTIQELENLKALRPKDRDLLNAKAIAVKKGQQYEYKVSVFGWVGEDTPPAAILDMTLDSWEIQPVQLKYRRYIDTWRSYEYSYEFPKTYLSMDELRADFPESDYIARVFFKVDQPGMGNVIDWWLELPDYNESTFKPQAEGELVWDNTAYTLFWTPATGTSWYDGWATEIKKGAVVWRSASLLTDPLSDETTPLTGIKKAQYDFSATLACNESIFKQNGQITAKAQTQTHWFSFKKPLPVYEDKITKAAVTAGKQNIGSISLSGQLTAIEADFLMAMADDEPVDIILSCDTMPLPIELEFPINSNTLKNGKFISTLPVGFDPQNPKATANFKYDTKTHQFMFTLKNYDMTGLSCPFEFEIEIGDFSGYAFEAAMTLDETVVNGAKACPPQLVQGLADNLTIEKELFKSGTAVGMDMLSVSGTFTLQAGDPGMPTQPLVIALGAQTFSVPASAFASKKTGVYTCTNVKDTVSGNAIISATLDFNKCTFTVLMKNSNILADGLTPFSLDVFGFPLNGLAKVKLGTRYTYWDLTRYDQDGESKFYHTNKGAFDTEIYINNYSDNYFILYEQTPAVEEGMYYTKDDDDSMLLTAMWFNKPQVAYINLDTLEITMWPSSLRPGQTYTQSSSTLKGEIEVDGNARQMVVGRVNTKVVVAPKATRVIVPAGPFNAFRIDESWNITSDLRRNNGVVGTFSIVITQTSFAEPGFGVVKRTRKTTIKAKTDEGVNINKTLTDTYELSN